MFSPEAKRNTIAISAFLVPVLLVKVAGFLIGAEGPRTAVAISQSEHASPALNDSMSRALTRRNAESTLTEEAVSFQAHIESLRDRPLKRTPIFHDRINEQSKPKPSQPQVMEEQRTLSVTITAIMTSSDGNIALIDGRPYTTGDTVADERWIISEINTRSRIVRFENVETGEIEEHEVARGR